MQTQSYESLETRFFANLAGGQFKAYRNDPVAFVHDILGVKLWERQIEAVDAVRIHDRVAKRSGHGVGKTLEVSCIAMWAVYALHWLVLSTAPTFRQVESVLWRQIHKLWYGAKKELPGSLTNVKLETADTMALGLSTNEPGRFQGYHDAEGILIIEDEAPGVPSPIHEAIEGVLAGGGKWVKTGNPTSPSGPFFDAFRSLGWHTLHVSSWEHPNVVQDKIVIPGAVTRKWCEDRLAEWGEESPLYQARVLGEFPDEGEDTLIRLSWAEGAFNGSRDTGSITRYPVGINGNNGVYRISDGGKDREDINGPVLVCDVARYGQDETVIGLRTGDTYTEIDRYVGKSLMHTVGNLVSLTDQYSADSVIVDDSGLGGGVTDRLEEQGVNVVPFNGGGESEDEKFINKRAEAWWSMREALRQGQVSINAKDADGFKYQLTSPKYKYNSKGKIQIESKEDMKKRGVKSPDRADALAMTFGETYAPLWHM